MRSLLNVYYLASSHIAIRCCFPQRQSVTAPQSAFLSPPGIGGIDRVGHRIQVTKGFTGWV